MELICDADIWVLHETDSKVENEPEERSEGGLEKALRWAAGKRKETEEGVIEANFKLVILAESLYLGFWINWCKTDGML